MIARRIARTAVLAALTLSLAAGLLARCVEPQPAFANRIGARP